MQLLKHLYHYVSKIVILLLCVMILLYGFISMFSVHEYVCYKVLFLQKQIPNQASCCGSCSKNIQHECLPNSIRCLSEIQSTRVHETCCFYISHLEYYPYSKVNFTATNIPVRDIYYRKVLSIDAFTGISNNIQHDFILFAQDKSRIQFSASIKLLV